MRYCYITDKGTYLSDDPPEMVAAEGYWRGMYEQKTRILIPEERWPTEIKEVIDRASSE